VDIARAIPAFRLVYYCMDDFAALPGVDWNMVSPLEAELVRAAHVVVVTSPVLLGLERFRGRPVCLLPHGVDFDLFASAQHGPDPEIARLVAHLPRPILGFAGLIDERIDLGLLTRVVEERLGSLLLVGEAHSDIRALARHARVLALGYQPHRDVPRYLAACDALVAPYCRGEATKALQPLKIREYLATGKPVVAVAIPALAALRDVVRLAASSDDFIAALRQVIANPAHGRAERIAYARAHAWSVRAREFEAFAGCD